MPNHEERPCPRCGTLFECKSASNGHCQCNRIELNRGQLDHLADLYDDCLCLDCLKQLKESGDDFR